MSGRNEDHVGTLLARNASTLGAEPAVTDRSGTLSWLALARQVDGFANQLAELSVGPGDRVALWLPNSGNYLLAMFAVARRGATAVHVNTRFGTTEVGDLLTRSGASVLVTQTGFGPIDFLGLLDGIKREALEGLHTVLCFGAAPAEVAEISVKAPVLDGSGVDVSSPDDACLIYTTGGTTAQPKLVVHTQRSIARHACEVMRCIGTDQPGAALLAAVPFCGTFGNIAAMAAVAGGAHIVCMDSFDPASGDALIRAHRVSHLVGDDRMLGRLAEAALGGAGPHETIRFFGVAAFHPDAEASCRLGVTAGLKPRAIYGSSEAQALFAIGSADQEGWGAVEPISPEADIAVIDQKGDNVLADKGELTIRAPSLFAGYLDDSQATSAAFSTAGRFRTGDLANQEGRGFLFHGRMGDVLRLGGFLVNPQEIEAFLQRQTGVTGAQVVGVQAGRSFAAVAFVTGADAQTLDEASLLRACRDSLARYKVPIRAVQIDAFPTSTGPNGPKISRAELRHRAAAMMENSDAAP